MADILIADATEGGKPPQQKQIQAVVMFQDKNYTILRNKEIVTNQDTLDMPLHMFFLAMGMLSARAYVPKVSQQSFVHTLKTLQSKFKKHIKDQSAVAAAIQRESEK